MANENKEFLKAIEELEVAKGFSKETIIAYLKEAIEKAFRNQLGGDDLDVRCNIDPETGSIEVFYVKKVVEEVEDDFLEISKKDADENGGNYQVGDEYFIPASISDLKKAKAVLVKMLFRQKVNEAEHANLLETFKDKIGTMITGKVEKVDLKGCSINIGKTSVYLQRKDMIKDERFRVGDPIKLFVSNVESKGGAHIVVTRASEGFLKCLFQEEIHEIYDGTIIIKAIAREAGERSKIAVYSNDPNVDPAGACIGPNGNRIQKIVAQLGNGSSKEKIDVITYSDNAALYLMESIKPAKALGIIMEDDPNDKNVTIVVKDDALSTAIGKKGVNVRLAAKLTGYHIDVLTESGIAEEELTYKSFEEVLSEDMEARLNKAKETIVEETPKVEETVDVLPGLPEGYVAPQARVYEDEVNDFDETLSETVEEEEVLNVPPKVEETTPLVEEESKPEVVVQPTQNVSTTTTLEDLERSLEKDNERIKKNTKGKVRRKKKTDSEEEEEEVSTTSHDPSNYMSIYTQEELDELEEDEQEDLNMDDDDIDYDEYDEYYDDDK